MQSERKATVVGALKANRAEFHALLESMSADQLRAPSLNPGWTNREVLFHATLAFLLLPTLFWLLSLFTRLPRRYSRAFANGLNFATPVFNPVNAMGARIGGHLISPARLELLYGWAQRRTLRRLAKLSDADLMAGMYYPSRWDALFTEYMTLEQLLAYPIEHYHFHVGQLTR